jgi:uncharacterized protein YggE
MTRLAPALLAATVLAGCATAPMAMAQPPMGPQSGMPPMSTIQPETTITLTGKGTVDHAPDIAMISLGVQVEAKTAAEAMAATGRENERRVRRSESRRDR